MPASPRIVEATVNWAKLDPREFTYAPCNICGTFRYETIGAITINRTEFFLCRCESCGLMWRNPLPGPTFSHELYSESYFSVDRHSPALVDHVGIRDSEPQSHDFRAEISERVVQTWISRGIQAPRPFGPRMPPLEDSTRKRFLEIGGGRGYLQRAAATHGWLTTGLEISPHGIKAAIARQAVVLPVTIEELCDRYVPYEQYFDLIVFYDFLEHVEDPARVLRMIRHLLADEGAIIFRVPNTVENPSAHLIDHLWHFSGATLPLLLDKESFEVTGAHLSGVFIPQNGPEVDNITVYAKKSEEPKGVSAPLIIEANPLGVVRPVPHS